MPRLSVLLIFGGESSEHDVSISSARNVYAAMDNDTYHVELCYIDTQGKWWLLDGWRENLEHHGGVQLAAVPGTKSFVTIPGDRIIKVDVMFPMLHGKNGEDGTIQGLAEMLKLPYVGPGVIGAAVTMDKDMTKRLLKQAGIPVVAWEVWNTYTALPDYEKVANILGHDMFIKPATAGSSVGITHLTSSEGWVGALQTAAKHSSQVIIEKAIKAREIELAVLGNDDPDVSQPGEIIPGEEFYSYDDKYGATSGSKSVIPADIKADTAQTMKALARQAYQLTGCRGLARVDFFLGDEGNIYLNEINSIPGFTNMSMYPKLWQEQGMKYSELINRLIELSLE